MPSYYCPECDEDYPKAKLFDDCPICDTNTLFRAGRSPTVTPEEGARRVMSKRAHAAFTQWCIANHRTESEALPPSVKVFLPRNYTYRDRVIANSVAELLDIVAPSTSELHVVIRGL